MVRHIVDAAAIATIFAVLAGAFASPTGDPITIVLCTAILFVIMFLVNLGLLRLVKKSYVRWIACGVDLVLVFPPFLLFSFVQR